MSDYHYVVEMLTYADYNPNYNKVREKN